MASSSSVGECLCALRRLAQPSSPCPSQQELSQYVECCVVLFQNHAQNLLSRSVGGSVLLQFSLDCTPVKSRKGVSHTHHGRVVKKSGKSVSEYLVQQVFVSATTATGLEHAVLFREPIVLKHGKAMSSLLACAMRCPGIGMSSSQAGIVHVRHQVHDRGISHGLFGGVSGHWMSQRTADSPRSAGSSGEAGLVELLEWHTVVGCAAHDTHNALRWAVSEFANDTLMHQVYVAMAASRSCMMSAVSGLAAWLFETVQAVPEAGLPDSGQRTELWTLLGLSA